MKQLLNIFVLLLLANMAMAQAPQGIPYQAVARNSSGSILVSTAISVRFTIRDSIATGVIKYRETFSVTTSVQGMFSVNVGQGTPVTGTFSGINWGTNAKFMQVEMDPAGGSSYIDMGTTQMMSVPYALYANQSGVPGAVDLPTVATGSISSISYTSAVSTDTLKANGGEYVFAKGVCIDTISMPSINKSIVSPGNTVGSYSVSFTGLLPGKTYYVRAFASNKNGTAYGNVVSFNTTALSAPTLTTDTVSSITNSGAICGGNITNDGGTTVTARGLCYGTTSNPTIAGSTLPIGSGIGTFSGTITGLASSTLYYVRAYATNATVTSYGAQRSFTTVLNSVPVISTYSVSAISYTSATSGITTTNNGGNPITEQGICWGTASNPLATGPHATASNSLGYFSINMTGLSPNTTYYVRAYSINSMGTAYGAQYTFTTLATTTPTVSTNSVISILTTSAISGGNITSDGGTGITTRGVCWGVSTTPTKDSAHTSDGTGSGLYNSNITGLTPGTTYNVRAYATNAIGTTYGALQSFTTATVVPTSSGVPIVGTSPVTYPGSGATAGSGGYVSIDGGSAVTSRGVCWGTSSNPTLSGSFSTDGAGLGYFTSSITGLTGCGTTYYVRAFATNSSGTAYGNQYTVSHLAVPVVVIDSTSSITYNSANINVSIPTDDGCVVTAKGVCWSLSANPTTSNTKTTNGSGSASFTATMTGLMSNLTYHVRAYVTNASGTFYGSDITVTTGIPAGRYIGESYAGGVIFYIDGTGNHGLVCAPTDQTSAEWGCNGTSIAGTGTTVGSGAANTAAIMASCTTVGTAAYVCDNLTLSGYSDWFLPSRDELNLMYNNLRVNNLGGFTTTGNYWSSSDYSANYAWAIDFTNGTTPRFNKNETYYVRAVRSF